MKTPTIVEELICEHCGGDMDAFEYSDTDSTEENSEFGRVCTDCGYTGSAIVEDGQLERLNGDAFFNTNKSYQSHQGWREEPSVLYKEHYKLTEDEVANDQTPEKSLEFTTDEVQNGYDPTIYYKCLCGYKFDSKKRLAIHLQAVAKNRGMDAVASQ